MSRLTELGCPLQRRAILKKLVPAPFPRYSLPAIPFPFSRVYTAGTVPLKRG